MTDDDRIGIHWPPGQRPKPGQKGLVYEITTVLDVDTKKGRIVWPDAEVGEMATENAQPTAVATVPEPPQGEHH